MAHVKIDITIDKIEAVGLENFSLHVDTQYSAEEVVAVMGALPQYMADLVKIVEASRP